MWVNQQYQKSGWLLQEAAKLRDAQTKKISLCITQNFSFQNCNFRKWSPYCNNNFLFRNRSGILDTIIFASKKLFSAAKKNGFKVTVTLRSKIILTVR